MKVSSDSKLITCILPKGIALNVCEKIMNEKGLVASNINNARGTGHITPKTHRTAGYASEKEVFTVIVDSEQSDEIFEYIFDIADMNKPHGGIIYINALQSVTHFSLPNIQEEE